MQRSVAAHGGGRARALAQRNHFPSTRSRPETEAVYAGSLIKAGFNHADPHPQRDLPAIPLDHPQWHRNDEGAAMTEIVAALLAFFSIGVFLAHAFDAYRMRPGRRF
jgi:hypothetical protein